MRWSWGPGGCGCLVVLAAVLLLAMLMAGSVMASALGLAS
jgi:hypothetical protein